MAAEIDKRAKKIADISKDIAKIEDGIFKDFIKQIGVANIREYEETQLKKAQELNEKKIQLVNQRSKVENRLQYEQKRDLKTPRDLLQKTVEEVQAQLDSLREKEKKVKKGDSNVQKKIEKLEAQAKG